MSFDTPPLVIRSNLNGFEFLKEDALWPVAHVMNPFAVFMITRSWSLGLVVMLINEIIEALIRGTREQDDGFVQHIQEHPLDSLVGDLVAGLLGMLMAKCLLIRVKWDYYFFPWTWTWPQNKAQAWRKGKYALQLLLYPSALHFSGIVIFQGLTSLGLILNFFWMPCILGLMYYFNRNDLVWTRAFIDPPTVTGTEITPTTIYFYKASFQQADVFAHKLYLQWLLFVTVFNASFVFRYTHTFIMMLVHSTLASLFLLYIPPLPCKI